MKYLERVCMILVTPSTLKAVEELRYETGAGTGRLDSVQYQQDSE